MDINYNYAKGYYHLFNAITAELKTLEAVWEAFPAGHDHLAREVDSVIASLQAAQIETEEMYISGGNVN